MRKLAVIGASMEGFAPHYNSHTVGYDSEGFPIYCSGHNVNGGIDSTGQSKLTVSDLPGAVSQMSGWTNDPCANRRFYPLEFSSSFYIQGNPVILEGARVTLNPGNGNITIANQNKLHIGR